MTPAAQTSRWGYRLREIVERTGLTRSAVDRHAKATGIPRRKIGNAVVLEADAVEREFGFQQEAPGPQMKVTADDLAFARRLLA